MMKRILTILLLLTGAACAQSPADKVWFDAVARLTPQGTGEAWTPADLGADMVVWLRSSDTQKMSIVSSEIDRWTNSVSGNTNAFAALNNFRRPGLTNETLNAYPVASFLGGLDHGTWSGNADLTSAGGVTIYYVMRLIAVPTGLVAPVQYQSGISGGTRVLFGFNSSQRISAIARRADNDAAGTMLTATGQTYVATNNWALLGFAMDLPAQTATLYANGSSIITSNAFTTAGATFDATNSFAVLVNNVGSQINMAVADVIVVRSGLSLADVRKIDGWAAWRYGLTALLPEAHPYKASAPTK